MDRQERIGRSIVTVAQMRAIEQSMFDAGMPVAALMEKAGLRLCDRLRQLYPTPSQVGILVGTGHNGGDALVVARELSLQGYEVKLYCPVSPQKELTLTHLNYARRLGIPLCEDLEALQTSDWLIDGLFGLGLSRDLSAQAQAMIEQVNQWDKPVVALDLPSGLDGDRGKPWGAAIRASHTLCLGLWKLGLLQEDALPWVGQAELIDIGISPPDPETLQRVTPTWIRETLPLPKPLTTHKYEQGHLLLVVGSDRYPGAAVLAGLGARASGVGMLSIAVPRSLKPFVAAQIPDAIIVACPETSHGSIDRLPPDFDLTRYDTIACGCGLTTEAVTLVQQLLKGPRPLVLDADALNILGEEAKLLLPHSAAATVLTPHLGEFRRLFPEQWAQATCRTEAIANAAAMTGATILLKGARVAIADAAGMLRINPESTPALARGGSGDVLTGLLGGLLAQNMTQGSPRPILDVVQTAVAWHGMAGIYAAAERTELGVDAQTLSQSLLPALKAFLTR
jgi:ADP-dependent NAD(P)H-hydrate dehydratase / NAD(P)H-hydrate epimerase